VVSATPFNLACTESIVLPYLALLVQSHGVSLVVVANLLQNLFHVLIDAQFREWRSLIADRALPVRLGPVIVEVRLEIEALGERESDTFSTTTINHTEPCVASLALANSIPECGCISCP